MRFLAGLVGIFFFCGLLAGQFALEEKILRQVEKKYGAKARKRLVAWQNLVNSDHSTTDKAKLEKVNTFFNFAQFTDDQKLWGKKDYWATPIEFLSKNGGDCEDFSIAKYFTLREMGVPEKKMLLTYVKAVKLNQAHMVLTYYPTPDAEPLVLDNLSSKIKLASKRKDLVPVYSFNGSGLWLAKERGRGKRVGGSSRLSHWKSLVTRMKKEGT